MVTDFFWSIILLVFVLSGLSRPYLALSAVIWVDVLKPQDLSFSFLAGKPLSLIVTVFFLTSLAINLKKIRRPKSLKPTISLLLLIVWITVCNYYAIFPDAAWFKYDFVVKTLIFCLFIPFAISNKRELDITIGLFVAALSYYVITAGLRSILGSGGYGVQLVVTRVGETGTTETSTLSMLSVFIIPLVVYLYKYTKICSARVYKLIFFLLIGCALASVIGTRARTGLIGVLTLITVFWFFYRNKFRVIMLLCALAPLIYVSVPDDYISRMNTIKSAKNESSALGRIVVWKWTIDFVNEHPVFGGGFGAHRANSGQLNRYIDSGVWIDEKEDSGKAFHSIYFESLGETGYIGLLIYLYIIYLVWKSCHLAKRFSNDVSIKMLSNTLILCLSVYCACGAFIGIAFAPWLFYLLGFSSILFSLSKAQEQSTAGISTATH